MLLTAASSEKLPNPDWWTIRATALVETDTNGTDWAGIGMLAPDNVAPGTVSADIVAPGNVALGTVAPGNVVRDNGRRAFDM